MDLLLRIRDLLRAPGRRGRVEREDALRHLYHSHEAGQQATLESVAGACRWSPDDATRVVDALVRRGWVQFTEGSLTMTEQGAQKAGQVVRAHRLWERYLADDTGVSARRWHRQADVAEHELSAGDADRLEAQLGFPAFDPHGDPIPGPDGRVPDAAPARSLAALPVGDRGVISHIEDEPEQMHARLVTAGLHAGALVERIPDTPAGEFQILDEEGRRHILETSAMAAITVVPALSATGGVPLTQLSPGDAGRIVRLGADCRGLERRRLLDLGFVPGTLITVERRAALGDPTAYRVRASLVALRRDLAQRILVAPTEAP